MTFVPSARSKHRFPCPTTTPLPAAVLNVVVNAPLLLQNTVPCQWFGTMTFRLPVSAPVVVRYEPLACASLSVTSAVVTATLAMLVMCWVWMDPIGIARYGFDAKEFAAESFNFLYTERTQTLNWPTWVVQLVLPLFALCFTLHAAANLVEDLGLRPRAAIAGFDLGNAEETVN